MSTHSISVDSLGASPNFGRVAVDFAGKKKIHKIIPDKNLPRLAVPFFSGVAM